MRDFCRKEKANWTGAEKVKEASGYGRRQVNEGNSKADGNWARRWISVHGGPSWIWETKQRTKTASEMRCDLDSIP